MGGKLYGPSYGTFLNFLRDSEKTDGAEIATRDFPNMKKVSTHSSKILDTRIKLSKAVVYIEAI